MTTAKEQHLVKLLEAQHLVHNRLEFAALAKALQWEKKETALSYLDFLRLFAKPLMYAALGNVISLLLQSHMKYSFLSLPLKVRDYQRVQYIQHIKRYEKLDPDIKEEIQTMQSVYMQLGSRSKGAAAECMLLCTHA